MRDMPSGSTLLGLARDVLLDDLMPLLPEEKRLDTLLVANCMAIAEREAKMGEGPARAMVRELEMLYRVATLSRTAREGGERSETGEGRTPLLLRLARDLRVGVFENSEPRARDARAILWRLTVAKLRQANPKFLAANGFD